MSLPLARSRPALDRFTLDPFVNEILDPVFEQIDELARGLRSSGNAVSKATQAIEHIAQLRAELSEARNQLNIGYHAILASHGALHHKMQYGQSQNVFDPYYQGRSLRLAKMLLIADAIAFHNQYLAPENLDYYTHNRDTILAEAHAIVASSSHVPETARLGVGQPPPRVFFLVPPSTDGRPSAPPVR